MQHPQIQPEEGNVRINITEISKVSGKDIAKYKYAIAIRTDRKTDCIYKYDNEIDMG